MLLHGVKEQTLSLLVTGFDISEASTTWTFETNLSYEGEIIFRLVTVLSLKKKRTDSIKNKKKVLFFNPNITQYIQHEPIKNGERES